jgi:hypothetical protein
MHWLNDETDRTWRCWGRYDKRTKPGREADNHYQNWLSRPLIPTQPLSLSPIPLGRSHKLSRNHHFFSRAYNRSFLSGLPIAFPPTEYKSPVALLDQLLHRTPTMSTLHPPRLAPIFATTPSVPGTPVHSIQTMRRKSAGHSGPLTKILVANRGVRFHHELDAYNSIPSIFRKSQSAYSVPPMSSRCTPLRSTHTKIGCPLIVKRYAALLADLDS